jgi:hypothetical protein
MVFIRLKFGRGGRLREDTTFFAFGTVLVRHYAVTIGEKAETIFLAAEM